MQAPKASLITASSTATSVPQLKLVSASRSAARHQRCSQLTAVQAADGPGDIEQVAVLSNN